MEEISAVTQVPIFEPKMIYNTAFPPPPMTSLFAAMVMITEVTALDDCTRAVSTMPNASNKKGFSIAVKKRCTLASSL